MSAATKMRRIVTVPARSNGHLGGRSAGGQKRVRQHVNPLKSAHQRLLDLPERWPAEVFAQPNNPAHLDVGSARGEFCLALAASRPELNVVGLEIRHAFADAAKREADTLGLRNAAFFACNASVQTPSLLEALCGGLRSVTISFPDPWFKERHKKRRVLQPPLARTLEAHLQPGGWMLLQSDVLEVASQMRATVTATATSLVDQRDETRWDARPRELAGIDTERERSSRELGRPVYRCLFVKRAEP